jgi:hypothetical protein
VDDESSKLRQLLALRLGENDAEAVTFRDYLLKLLAAVWREEESFSGKRPFGNSGWKEELFRPAVAAGLVPGELDEDGYVNELDEDTADELIYACIASLDYSNATGTAASGHTEPDAEWIITTVASNTGSMTDEQAETLTCELPGYATTSYNSRRGYVVMRFTVTAHGVGEASSAAVKHTQSAYVKAFGETAKLEQLRVTPAGAAPKPQES